MFHLLPALPLFAAQLVQTNQAARNAAYSANHSTCERGGTTKSQRSLIDPYSRVWPTRHGAHVS